MDVDDRENMLKDKRRKQILLDFVELTCLNTNKNTSFTTETENNLKENQNGGIGGRDWGKMQERKREGVELGRK